VTEGMYQVIVPRLYAPETVWLMDAADKRQKLTRRDLEYLFSEYDEPFPDITQDTPIDWAENPFNRNFDTDPDDALGIHEDEGFDGTYGADWSTDIPGELVMADSRFTAASAMSAASIMLALNLDTAMAAELTAGYGGAVLTKIVAKIEEEGDYGGLNLFSIVAGESESYMAETWGVTSGDEETYRLLWVYRPGGITGLGAQPGFKGYIEEFQHYLLDVTGDAVTGNPVFLPPCDATYKMTVWGRFYPPAMSAASDWNVLTEKNPQLVILATLYRLEIAMRNTEGSNDWLVQLERELNLMDTDRTAARMEGPAVDWTMNG